MPVITDKQAPQTRRLGAPMRAAVDLRDTSRIRTRPNVDASFGVPQARREGTIATMRGFRHQKRM